MGSSPFFCLRLFWIQGKALSDVVFWRVSDWGNGHLTGRKMQWCVVVSMLALWRWTIAGKTTLTSAITKVLSETGGATFIDYGNIDKVR